MWAILWLQDQIRMKLTKWFNSSSPVLLWKILGSWNFFFFFGYLYYKHKGWDSYSQDKYITDLLKKPHIQDAKSLPTPMSASTVLSSHHGSLFEDPSLCMSILIGLQYVTISRLDLYFGVNRVCQYMANSLDSHSKAATYIKIS